MIVRVRLYFKPSGLRCEMIITPLERVLGRDSCTCSSEAICNFYIFFLWLAPLTLVLGEHFVLKDLPFYKVSCLVDIKARQACLDAHEKKHQDGTLCQALDSTS